MMQQKKNGQMDPGALKGLIDSLSQMADMPQPDNHIVGTGMNKMCSSSGARTNGAGRRCASSVLPFFEPGTGASSVL